MVRKTTIEELGTVEELQGHMCLSENLSDGPRTGAVTAEFGCKTGQKLAYGIEKRGHKYLPPIFLLSVSHLEFHEDFDFAIKHDLTV